jgi:hypothetical protein
MSAVRTLPGHILLASALVCSGALAGCSAGAQANTTHTAASCGTVRDRAPEWPRELPDGSRLVSEVHTSFVVVTDCGVQTLIKSSDDDGCYSMTGYGLQRYPCHR